MICFLGMIVFGILGIFSAAHRKVAKEAFDCIFRRITLRKCETGLDTKLKSTIVGRSLKKHHSLGKFVYKNFEIVSWIFTILLVISMVWTAVSGYNYYAYGNCNGPSVEEQEGLCLFDPNSNNAKISDCTNEDILTQTVNGELTIKNSNLSTFPVYKPANYTDELVYIGCYTCVNTKKVNPTINKLVVENKNTLSFTFIHLPLNKDHEYISKISNCLFQTDKASFWTFHNSLMQMPVEKIRNRTDVLNTLSKIDNLDPEKIIACEKSTEANQLFQEQLVELNKINLEGTPTIFVNQQPFIGPKPGRVYERQLSTYVDWVGYTLILLGALIILTILYFALFKRD